MALLRPPGRCDEPGPLVATEPDHRGAPVRSGVLVLVVAAAVLTALAAVGASALLGRPAPSLLGSDAPPWWVAPSLRGVRDAAGALTLGLLLLTAGVVSPAGAPGSAAAPPWRAALTGVRLAALSSAVAAVTGAASVVVATAEITGRAVLHPGTAGDVVTLLGQVGGYRMLAYAAACSLVVAVVAARASDRPRLRTTLGRLAVAATAAAALVGVSGHAGGHEAVVGALAVHVLAASAWAGGLAALLVLRTTTGTDVAALLPRWSRLAGLCFVAVALSGAAAVALRWTTGEPGGPWLLLAGGKLGLLALLAVAGRLQRRRVVARASAGGPVPWQDMTRLGVAELVLMCVAAGAGIALSSTG